ncbi:ABC transporter permease [Oceanibaculum nanhaiense]|jgi:peptide/nickel transport system permease protein|uniref:ABC transporter permease n=1 Tax=Oceanibaculum nanhaiense TaxID=1909734 RepID=UPI000A382D83|nr:ABC transporter permease [Oceanibaculum nanhaiense]MBC7137045.1 ABC transporter permease [Oceanibaculum nanhaiense]
MSAESTDIIAGAPGPELVPEAAKAKAIPPWRRLFSSFCESKLAVVGLITLVAIILVALFAPWISPQDPFDLSQIDIMDSKMPPGSESYTGQVYWLGTDGQGRDMLSGIFYGLRISLTVGILSGFFALIIGTSLGLTAAYFGGKIETLIMRIVDLQLSFPAILVALMLLAILGRGVDKVILALIIVQWAYYARTARSAALVERRKEYIESARSLALSTPRIIFRHLLPNCLPPVIVIGTVQVANAIALEATLSFLGIGLPVTEPSLGLLISNGFNYLLSGRYWISFFPGVALLVTIVAINLVGDQLRDILNPRLQR